MTSRQIDNLERTRNTDAQIDWYGELREFVESAPWSAHDKVNYFPVFATRQNITKFLECYEFYKLAAEVPGAFVEAGVGSGSFLMGLAHFCAIFEGYNYTRRIVGFDTFSGFTEPAPQDMTSDAAHMRSGGLAWDSLEILERAIGLYDRNRSIGNIPKIELVKGDMSRTLPEYLEANPHLVVAMLHLDVDLYTPTRDALRLLISRMPKGGILIFDELNHKDYPGETVAAAEVLGIDKLRLRRLPMSSAAAYALLE